jgi:serine/threonine-protein kinase
MTGRIVANYRLERLLGEGGMGEVYLARHATIGKRVAVKLLHGYLRSDADALARFSQEAKAVNDINHPNIVDIIDFGQIDNLVYLTMEYLEGEDLHDRLMTTGLSMEASRTVLIQCASALAASHRRGIIHRDIKPENIFICRRRGETIFVKLLDFGIAKLTREQDRGVQTLTGELFGTPLYMSPEQAAGARLVDARSDVYSLGVVMYELLTGRLPFECQTLSDALLAHATQTALRVTDLNPNVPSDIAAVCERAIEKDPAARFQSMKELHSALTSAAWSRAVTVVVQRTANGASITTRRRAPRRALAGSALLLLALAGAAWVARSRKPPRPPPLAPAVAAPAPAAAPREVRIAIRSEPPGALVVCDGKALGRSPVALATRAGGPPLQIEVRLRGFERVLRTVEADRDQEVALSLRRLPSGKKAKGTGDSVLYPPSYR